MHGGYYATAAFQLDRLRHVATIDEKMFCMWTQSVAMRSAIMLVPLLFTNRNLSRRYSHKKGTRRVSMVSS